MFNFNTNKTPLFTNEFTRDIEEFCVLKTKPNFILSNARVVSNVAQLCINNPENVSSRISFIF